MGFEIKVFLNNQYQITIETPSEYGESIHSLLYKSGYALTEYYPNAIGVPAHENAFNLTPNPEMKYYNIMILAQNKETSPKIIAEIIRNEFGLELYQTGDEFVIASE